MAIDLSLAHPGDVVRQRDELRAEVARLTAALDAKDQHESEHCGVPWCRGCAELFDGLKAAIRAASTWTGDALCWCDEDDAPDCATPTCVRLRALLAGQPKGGELHE